MSVHTNGSDHQLYTSFVIATVKNLALYCKPIYPKSFEIFLLIIHTIQQVIP